jgi:hypothetical protein
MYYLPETSQQVFGFKNMSYLAYGNTTIKLLAAAYSKNPNLVIESKPELSRESTCSPQAWKKKCILQVMFPSMHLNG